MELFNRHKEIFVSRNWSIVDVSQLQRNQVPSPIRVIPSVILDAFNTNDFQLHASGIRETVKSMVDVVRMTRKNEESARPPSPVQTKNHNLQNMAINMEMGCELDDEMGEFCKPGMSHKLSGEMIGQDEQQRPIWKKTSNSLDDIWNQTSNLLPSEDRLDPKKRALFNEIEEELNGNTGEKNTKMPEPLSFSDYLQPQMQPSSQYTSDEMFTISNPRKKSRMRIEDQLEQYQKMRDSDPYISNPVQRAGGF